MAGYARNVGVNNADRDFDARIAAETPNKVFLDRWSVKTHTVDLQLPRRSLRTALASFGLRTEYVQTRQRTQRIGKLAERVVVPEREEDRNARLMKALYTVLERHSRANRRTGAVKNVASQCHEVHFPLNSRPDYPVPCLIPGLLKELPQRPVRPRQARKGASKVKVSSMQEFDGRHRVETSLVVVVKCARGRYVSIYATSWPEISPHSARLEARFAKPSPQAGEGRVRGRWGPIPRVTTTTGQMFSCPVGPRCSIVPVDGCPVMRRTASESINMRPFGVPGCERATRRRYILRNELSARELRLRIGSRTAWCLLSSLLMAFLLSISLLTCLPSTAHASDNGFEDATPGRVLAFPRDHGKHPEFQTEWWYFTGNLESNQGRRWGFQLTFFRRGMSRRPSSEGSAWRISDLYPAHFAITDVETRKFLYEELISREGPGLAVAASDRLQVRVKDWSAEFAGNEIRVRARAKGCSLELALTPMKPVVLHGQGGYSRKSDREKQASYYYSLTRLSAKGALTFDGTTRPVTGLAWMDHEFSSSVLAEDQVGWDWFSLQLEDGSELMIFQMRRKDGTFEPPVGTLVAQDGTAKQMSSSHITISRTGSWRSPHTKAEYPSGWNIELADEHTKLHVAPLVEDQELASGKSTGIVYWEGAVRITGSRGGKTVNGHGYVELTGYAHSMAGRL